MMRDGAVVVAYSLAHESTNFAYVKIRCRLVLMIALITKLLLEGDDISQSYLRCTGLRIDNVVSGSIATVRYKQCTSITCQILLEIGYSTCHKKRCWQRSSRMSSSESCNHAMHIFCTQHITCTQRKKSRRLYQHAYSMLPQNYHHQDVRWRWKWYRI